MDSDLSTYEAGYLLDILCCLRNIGTSVQGLNHILVCAGTEEDIIVIFDSKEDHLELSIDNLQVMKCK